MAKVDHSRICAFVENAGDRFPERTNLPFWWDRVPEDELDQDLPAYTARDMLLASYSNWSFTKRWAWDGMKKLLAVLLERREPIPDTLQYWAYGVALKTRPRPRMAKNAERNARMAHVFRALHEELNLSKEDAIGEIAVALSKSEGTVRSVVDLVRDARPFEKLS